MEILLKKKSGLHSLGMIFILFMLMLVGLFLSQAIVKATVPYLFGISDADSFLTSPDSQLKNPLALLYLQAMCSSIGFFLLPVIMYHIIFRFDMTSAMGLKVYPPARLWLLAIAVMLISAVFIQLLVQINSAIPLSGHWKELRSAQEEVDKMVEAFFSGAGTGRFLVLTLVVALLPAVAEELCFRGTIQQTLMQTHLGPIGAIIVSGLTFSLFHFEFDNFLAIWCMGIVLGYLYYYSGSIWVSMSAHFFNNFIMVAGKYAYMKGLLHMDIMSNDTLPLYITIPAGGLMIAGLVLMHRWRQSPTISLADVQEDHRTPPGKTNTDGANNID